METKEQKIERLLQRKHFLEKRINDFKDYMPQTYYIANKIYNDRRKKLIDELRQVEKELEEIRLWNEIIAEQQLKELEDENKGNRIDGVGRDCL